MTNIRGQIAMMPAEKACYCSDPSPHWHGYEAVFDGAKWLPVTSQAGIDFLMSMQEAGMARQKQAANTNG